MQINDFAFSRFELIPVAPNLWKLASDVAITVNLPAGKGWRFTLRKDFLTNLRSGSDLINPIIPRMGDEGRTIAYILHDALYTWTGVNSEWHFLDKKTADGLLKAMLSFCDECAGFQIALLRSQLAETKDKALQKKIKDEIKFVKSQILGSFKIWAIHKAVDWFGGSAYNEKNPPPYDKNNGKILMEVL